MKHPSIVEIESIFIGTSSFPAFGYIVMPFYSNGDLRDFCLKSNPNQKIIKSVFLKFYFKKN